MADILKEIHCTDAKDFISKFSYGGKYFHLRDENFIFRGEPSDQYSLIPSSLREENQTKIEKIVRNLVPGLSKDNFDLSLESSQILSEYVLLNMFFKKCDYNGLYIPDITGLRSLVGHITKLTQEIKKIGYWLPLEYIELAGLAQHYGIFTRLLDWSQDLNIALYFAVSGYINKTSKNLPKNIVVWALYSDIVVDTEFDMTRLKIFIPKYNGNPNLRAQKGAFTLWQIERNIIRPTNRTPINELIIEGLKSKGTKVSAFPILYKIYIPTDGCDELRTYLKTSGYDSSRLFPGYRGVTQSILNNL